jgi:pimeloyl-ACP methyl ester carboxylesterase
MAALDFGDPGRPVDIVFVHANGFNGRTYRSILQPLARDLRILAPDLRGHGRTTLPLGKRWRRSWRDLRDDLLALLEALDGPPVTLSGHSMGGTVSILAAAKAPAKVRDLVLFDPVMWGQVGVLMAHIPFAAEMTARRAPIAVQAARRRSVFDSRAAAFAAYKGRGAFKTWPDAMLRDYIADGFRDRPDGKVELACPPKWEASLYTTHAHDPYAAIRRFGRPVRILKGTRGSTCRIKDIAAFERRYPNAGVEKVEGGHFFPMEKPGAVRAALRSRTSPSA